MSDRQGPDEREVQRRGAIVHAQIVVVILMLVTQIWLITAALNNLLAGHPRTTWPLAAFSGLAFVINLLVLRSYRKR